MIDIICNIRSGGHQFSDNIFDNGSFRSRQPKYKLPKCRPFLIAFLNVIDENNVTPSTSVDPRMVGVK